MIPRRRRMSAAMALAICPRRYRRFRRPRKSPHGTYDRTATPSDRDLLAWLKFADIYIYRSARCQGCRVGTQLTDQGDKSCSSAYCARNSGCDMEKVAARFSNWEIVSAL